MRISNIYKLLQSSKLFHGATSYRTKTMNSFRKYSSHLERSPIIGNGAESYGGSRFQSENGSDWYRQRFANLRHKNVDEDRRTNESRGYNARERTRFYYGEH